ncbi:zinc carboxypeptidase [Streptomyces aureoverticillatus]|nr:zinc carboxypeptidase [Streptomyces aureoverticillatus]
MEDPMEVRMGITEYLAELPEIERFCTVDELHDSVERLARERPDVCRIRRVGSSRLGEPLRLLSVGHGPRNALIVGGPHPNEPIGLLTVRHLARLVADHEELRSGFTWHFLPCVDPDGARLNEGWFAGPYTIRHYHSRLYRPAFADQPEWTFPVLDERAYFDRTLPETQALARVIDELRPDFQYSLHNADFGGVFYVLSDPVPGLAEDLAEIAASQGVPLSLGPVDTLGWPEAGPAVYLMPPAEEILAAHARNGGEPRGGGSSTHYAKRHGTTTLITDAPLWYDPRADDTSPAGQAYAAVLRAAAGRLREDADVLGEVYDSVLPHLVVPTPFRAAVADSLATGRAFADADDAMAATVEGREATVAEQFSAGSVPHMLRLRGAGLLRRQLAAETAAGNVSPPLRAAARRADALFDDWCAQAEQELRAEPFGLRRLVALQLGAALSTVARLTSERPITSERLTSDKERGR